MVKKILVVDDEEDIVFALKVILDKAGYKTITATSGRQALTKLRRQKVDLLIIDYFMPEMNGKELIDKIRGDAKVKNPGIILISVAKVSDKYKADNKPVKGVYFIKKPFKNSYLLQIVNKSLARHH